MAALFGKKEDGPTAAASPAAAEIARLSETTSLRSRRRTFPPGGDRRPLKSPVEL